MVRVHPSDLSSVISTIDNLLRLQLLAIKLRDVENFASWDVRADLYRARVVLLTILNSINVDEA